MNPVNPDSTNSDSSQSNAPDPHALSVRPATVKDRQAVIQLINSIYAEYDDRVCLEDAESDLLEVPELFERAGGVFWVLADERGHVWGCHAALPINKNEGLCTFRRLYLAKPLRGSKWGRELMQIAIDWAWERGFKKIEFWSDSRFERAHQFFEKFGFQRSGETRTMHDSYAPYTEYYYSLKRPTEP